MSGGTWDYMFQPGKAEPDWKLFEQLWRLAQESEYIIDRSEAGDTDRASAEARLYALWVEALNRMYNERH